MILGNLVAGTSIGCSIGGVALTILGTFRRDKVIRKQEAARFDGGDTRIAVQMEAARVGRLGMAVLGIGVVLPVLVPAPATAPTLWTVVIAAIVLLLVLLIGWARKWWFWNRERPREVITAESVLRSADAD